MDIDMEPSPPEGERGRWRGLTVCIDIDIDVEPSPPAGEREDGEA